LAILVDEATEVDCAGKGFLLRAAGLLEAPRRLSLLTLEQPKVAAPAKGKRSPRPTGIRLRPATVFPDLENLAAELRSAEFHNAAV
jgi:hypothetical protein